jgi:hypothetical protein
VSCRGGGTRPSAIPTRVRTPSTCETHRRRSGKRR